MSELSKTDWWVSMASLITAPRSGLIVGDYRFCGADLLLWDLSGGYLCPDLGKQAKTAHT